MIIEIVRKNFYKKNRAKMALFFYCNLNLFLMLISITYLGIQHLYTGPVADGPKTLIVVSDPFPAIDA